MTDWSDSAPVREYLARTPESRKWMERAAGSMPGGNTRTTTHHPPYPVMFNHGDGSWLTDMDGRRYVDLHYNGLSIIHGHRFAPIREAMAEALSRGTAWSGGSDRQVEFAELIAGRIPGEWRVRFCNSGSEAGMLAAKAARRATRRPMILKFKYAYHGSDPDLEAGLYGIEEIEGRTALANFNDLESVAAAFDRHAGDIAAVIYEPVMFTGRVVVAEDGFLHGVEALARSHGALSILDDCLMLRLAVGGSVEALGCRPDLIVLGKFIGGGTPVGAVVGRPEVMQCFDPRHGGSMFHGGSFNGNVLGCTAGLATLRALDAQAIARMDSRAARLRRSVVQAGEALGIRLAVSGAGSVGGIEFLDETVRHEEDPNALGVAAVFHLACLNAGLAMGPGGLFALATSFDDGALDHAIGGFAAALRDVSEVIG